jgi:hypothetical protein
MQLVVSQFITQLCVDKAKRTPVSLTSTGRGTLGEKLHCNALKR